MKIFFRIVVLFFSMSILMTPYWFEDVAFMRYLFLTLHELLCFFSLIGLGYWVYLAIEEKSNELEEERRERERRKSLNKTMEAL